MLKNLFIRDKRHKFAEHLQKKGICNIISSDQNKMILHFTISNFRSIREPQTISFEASKDTHLEDYYVIKKGNYRILKMAVILGANASGKSNIIRAFNLFAQLILKPCENKTSKIEYDKFALDDACSNGDSIMIVNFICGEQKYRYELHFNNEMVTSETLTRHPFGELRAHKVFKRKTDKKSKLSNISWGDNFKSTSNTRDLNINLLHNRTVFGAFQTSNVDIPWMKEIVDWADSSLLPSVFSIDQHISDTITEAISKEKIDKKLMAQQLKKADIGVSDFQIEKQTNNLPKELVELLLSDEDVPSDLKDKIRKDPTSEDLSVRLLHKGKGMVKPFDFSKESGGTQRYYELSGILLMLIKSQHFVAIDELECRLHPDLYIHFIATFLNNTKKSQILFTTHMREFLADKDLFRDDVVWFTEKSEEGATELYSLADFGSDVLRTSTNRYNVYRAGRLGAIPRLEDTFFATLNN